MKASSLLAFIRPFMVATPIGLLAAWTVMSGCAAPHDLPPWFDQIQRLPIQSVTVQGYRVAYLDQGDGSPVVLLHGFGGSMWQWEYQQRDLSSRYRLLTPDLLGSGLSDKPDISYGPDEMVEYFRGFLDALHIERATLIGNSMGAGLATAFALTYPDRVDRLVLIGGLPPDIETNLTSPLMKRVVETQLPIWLMELGNWLFGSSATEQVLREIVHDHTLLTPAVMERSKQNRKRPGLLRPLMSLRDHLPRWEREFAPRLPTITHPTLILWGKEDRVFPPHVGQQMHTLIPHSTLHVIPSAGHIPQWERPQQVNRLLLTFLES